MLFHILHMTCLFRESVSQLLAPTPAPTQSFLCSFVEPPGAALTTNLPCYHSFPVTAFSGGLVEYPNGALITTDSIPCVQQREWIPLPTAMSSVDVSLVGNGSTVSVTDTNPLQTPFILTAAAPSTEEHTNLPKGLVTSFVALGLICLTLAIRLFWRYLQSTSDTCKRCGEYLCWLRDILGVLCGRWIKSLVAAVLPQPALFDFCPDESWKEQFGSRLLAMHQIILFIDLALYPLPLLAMVLDHSWDSVLTSVCTCLSRVFLTILKIMTRRNEAEKGPKSLGIAFRQHRKRTSRYHQFIEARLTNAYWHCIEAAVLVSNETCDATVNATADAAIDAADDATVDRTDARPADIAITDGLLRSGAPVIEDHFTRKGTAYVHVVLFGIAVLYILRSAVSSLDKPSEYLFALTVVVDRILEVAAKILATQIAAELARYKAERLELCPKCRDQICDLSDPDELQTKSPSWYAQLVRGYRCIRWYWRMLCVYTDEVVVKEVLKLVTARPCRIQRTGPSGS
ncbi:hypothetical protein ARMSODRAFT_10279 [Armillaria solidipes]|uniref:Uncharacterized protein n=1 Tax=Armillaria solidipes TaxID=1076256 RepID=A0A2H3C419_9AGAR|nr:hypothetical protein ARMSODRAFT_10279 [Armillaria solidipes]